MFWKKAATKANSTSGFPVPPGPLISVNEGIDIPSDNNSLSHLIFVFNFVMIAFIIILYQLFSFRNSGNARL